MKEIPKPRVIYFDGRRLHATYLGNTWLEAEEAAYPKGGFTRRAYVRFADGELRVVKVSIPDTYFSIPAKAKISGTTVNGFVMMDNDEYAFHAHS